jgi:hypothetical protein
MIKKPNKLVAARAALERAAEDLGDPDRLGQLRDAINSLLQLMSGVSPQIEKDIAKKLILGMTRSFLFRSINIWISSRRAGSFWISSTITNCCWGSAFAAGTLDEH